MSDAATDIDDYLAGLPDEPRATLTEMRRMIRAVAPDAVESISYGMPTFSHRGKHLAYFSAWKNHCALYGLNGAGHRRELEGYKVVKGTIQFPLGQPLPEPVVRMLVTERLAEIDAAAKGPTR